MRPNLTREQIVLATILFIIGVADPVLPAILSAIGVGDPDLLSPYLVIVVVTISVIIHLYQIHRSNEKVATKELEADHVVAGSATTGHVLIGGVPKEDSNKDE